MNDKGKPSDTSVEITYLKYGFSILCVALIAVTVIFLAFLVYMIRFESLPSHDVHGVAISVVGVVGTLVGFFFGHHAAALGRVRAESRAESLQQKADSLHEQKEQVTKKAIERLRNFGEEEAKSFQDEARKMEQGNSME